MLTPEQNTTSKSGFPVTCRIPLIPVTSHVLSVILMLNLVGCSRPEPATFSEATESSGSHLNAASTRTDTRADRQRTPIYRFDGGDIRPGKRKFCDFEIPVDHHGPSRVIFGGSSAPFVSVEIDTRADGSRMPQDSEGAILLEAGEPIPLHVTFRLPGDALERFGYEDRRFNSNVRLYREDPDRPGKYLPIGAEVRARILDPEPVQEEPTETGAGDAEQGGC